MSKLRFPVSIKAPKEKVWKNLWDDKTYRQWTAAFMEGSYAESDWKEGSRILFLGPGGDGMFGIIEKLIPNKQMVFKHQGEIKNGAEEKKDWGEARESYYLEEKNGVTELNVEMDSIGADMDGYFMETFPKALAVLKGIAEK